jgi:hypothetical protein
MRHNWEVFRSSRVLRFAKLSFADQAATIEALAMVTAARAVLSTVNPGTLGRILRPIISDTVPPGGSDDAGLVETVDRVRNSVRRASRIVPRATCLVQALGGWWMFKTRRIPAQIRIGVDKNEQGFSAHAWLVIGETIVLGGVDSAARFVVLRS